MRIAWDGRALVGPRTGIGWYTHHLIRGFLALEEEWSADLYLNSAIRDDFGGRIRPRIRRFPNTVHLRFVWENHILPGCLKRDLPDVWHSPMTLAPRLDSVPIVTTIHDIAFLLFPEIMPRSYRNYWMRRTREACNRSALVIAVSESTKRDVVENFEVDPDKVRVVLEAPDPFMNPASGEDDLERVRERIGAPRSFALFVGTLEPRKNLPFLIDCYASPKGAELPPLVVAGGAGWLQRDLDEKIRRLGDRIRMVGYLDREDLRALYRSADVVVAPSLYEGFGLQAAEAMACGAVVVASDRSSLPEVVGHGGILLPLDQPETWVDKILELVENADLRKNWSKRAVERAQVFRWEKAAQETIQIYGEAIGMRG